jgi:hypothetical protein
MSGYLMGDDWHFPEKREAKKNLDSRGIKKDFEHE